MCGPNGTTFAMAPHLYEGGGFLVPLRVLCHRNFWWCGCTFCQRHEAFGTTIPNALILAYSIHKPKQNKLYYSCTLLLSDRAPKPNHRHHFDTASNIPTISNCILHSVQSHLILYTYIQTKRSTKPHNNNHTSDHNQSIKISSHQKQTTVILILSKTISNQLIHISNKNILWIRNPTLCELHTVSRNTISEQAVPPST